jgi:adenylate cyclase
MKQAVFDSEFDGKILMVDDSVENLKLLSGLLGSHYRLKVAKDGQTALKLLEEDAEIQLVLLDVEMPGIDGFEVCRRIKANPKTAALPVIFLTGRGDGASEVEGLNAGGVDYITKPFKPEIVHARIRSQWALQASKAKANELLRVVLPDNVVQSLLRDGTYEPEHHADASILFCDLVGFTKATTTMTPQALVSELSTMFGTFDAIAARWGVTRIKTMGDGYMAVCGIDGNRERHAQRLAHAALEMVEAVRSQAAAGPHPWQCRIGLHAGALMSGIVGTTRFQFDVMGDSVNIAARVESAGQPMAVTVSEEFIAALGSGMSQTTSIGMHQLKGKGERELWRLDSVAPMSEVGMC